MIFFRYLELIWTPKKLLVKHQNVLFPFFFQKTNPMNMHASIFLYYYGGHLKQQCKFCANMFVLGTLPFFPITNILCVVTILRCLDVVV